jgi:RNA polymerase sigma factor (sigma-70 family)
MASGAMGAVCRQLERVFNSGGVAGLSEGQLLDRFVTRRDDVAFEALVARHGPMVMGVCRRLLRDPNDVDDAFQATFLVLVRKAGTLRRRDLLGNWLYGVAFKVASRSRSVAVRRFATETPTEEVEALAGVYDSPEAALGPDPTLHEELTRLPEKYRAPVVLCYLEGLTHEEAANRLGWPVGTVKGRLARARDLLRSRLTRRGVTVASAAVALDLLGRDAPAALPERLVIPTVKAASQVAAGQAAAGIVSVQAAALCEGVVHAMSLRTIKMALTSAAVAGTLVTGAGAFAYQASGTGSGPRPTATTAKTTSETTKRQPFDLDNDPDRVVTQRKTAVQPSPSPNDPFADARRDQATATESTFAKLLGRTHNGPPDAFDQLARWSRSTRDAEIALATSPEEVIAAQRAHLSRMKLMHGVAQRLSGPDQGRKADIARAYAEEAQRNLQTSPGRSTGNPTGAKPGRTDNVDVMKVERPIGTTSEANPRPNPTPAPDPGPQPSPVPDLRRNPTPAPDAGPEPSPAPDLRPNPTPAPDAGPEPSPAPDLRPNPTPAPDAGPEPSPSPAKPGGSPEATASPGTPNPAVAGRAPGGKPGAAMPAGAPGTTGDTVTTGPGGGGFGGFGGGNANPQLDRLNIAIASLAPKVAAKDTSPKCKAILTKLEQPIAMTFANETPLEDVLKYIKSATQGPNDPGIPIYLDPVGLQEAERTMTSPVTLDLEGVPLKTTLRLMLKQIGLAYCVKDGLLIISSPHGIYQELLEGADPQTLQEGVMNGLFPGMGGRRGGGGFQ